MFKWFWTVFSLGAPAVQQQINFRVDTKSHSVQWRHVGLSNWLFHLLVVKGLIVQLRLVLPLVDSSKVHSLSTKWSLTPCYKSGWLIIGIAKVSDVCARCTRYRHSYWLYLMSGKFLARFYFGNDKLLYFVSSTDPQQKQSLNIHSSGIQRSS